jgi:carbonic anhydrase
MAPGPRSDLTPEQAMFRLHDGNLRFLAGQVPPGLRDPGSHRLVAGAQAPFAALLACADSRVAPEILFSCGLGELFVVRNAGNTADAAATGSLEYAVAELGVPLIGVMGHDRCGAVQAALSVVGQGARLPGAMAEMIAPILPSAIRGCRDCAEDPLRATAENHVRDVVDTLLARSRIIAEAVEAGRLKVIGGVYDLDEGRVRLVA